ncbi:hypothetical protein ACFFLM_11875 [Deinococcus oregonensis]|uniref:Uncharacterized protein n=1 Tax=Deinococcus oregonensis TaxID=1805970 RepID=A0ABV6B1A8_9DEIO
MTESQKLRGELISNSLAHILVESLGEKFIKQNMDDVILTLDEFTSWRVLADSLSKACGVDYGYAYNEIIKSASKVSGSNERSQEIIASLNNHGFQDWLEEYS